MQVSDDRLGWPCLGHRSPVDRTRRVALQHQ